LEPSIPEPDNWPDIPLSRSDKIIPRTEQHNEPKRVSFSSIVEVKSFNDIVDAYLAKSKHEPKESELSAKAVDCYLDPPSTANDVEALGLLSNSSKRNKGIEHAKKLLGKKLAQPSFRCPRCLHFCRIPVG
jgi:hypothetical protein